MVDDCPKIGRSKFRGPQTVNFDAQNMALHKTNELPPISATYLLNMFPIPPD